MEVLRILNSPDLEKYREIAEPRATLNSPFRKGGYRGITKLAAFL
jgi:hypothetical protein